MSAIASHWEQTLEPPIHWVECTLSVVGVHFPLISDCVSRLSCLPDGITEIPEHALSQYPENIATNVHSVLWLTASEHWLRRLALAIMKLANRSECVFPHLPVNCRVRPFPFPKGILHLLNCFACFYFLFHFVLFVSQFLGDRDTLYLMKSFSSTSVCLCIDL